MALQIGIVELVIARFGETGDTEKSDFDDRSISSLTSAPVAFRAAHSASYLVQLWIRSMR